MLGDKDSTYVLSIGIGPYKWTKWISKVLLSHSDRAVRPCQLFDWPLGNVKECKWTTSAGPATTYLTPAGSSQRSTHAYGGLHL